MQFAPGFDPPLRTEALAWVQRSAGAVAAYFGRFPVQQVDLLLLPTDGGGIRGSVTYAEPPMLIRVRVSRQTRRTQFLENWILVHQMVHQAVPRIPDAQSWLHEGIATYVESVARGHAGLVGLVGLAAGGNYNVAWPVKRILSTADRGVGRTTLMTLYRGMKDSPEPAALDALWRDLGVNGNSLSDDAPLAAVRRAILSWSTRRAASSRRHAKLLSSC